jgi:hypothetical protein
MVFGSDDPQAELRKLQKKLAKQRKLKEERPIDWAAQFALSPLAISLICVAILGLILVYFSYRVDKGRKPPATYPASGSVLVVPGNRPPGRALIQFTPIGETTLSVLGEVTENGSFTLYTISGKHRVAGAPIGEYRVTVQPFSSDQSTLIYSVEKPVKIGPSKNELKLQVRAGLNNGKAK